MQRWVAEDLAGEHGLTTKPMFGGLAWLCGGHLCLGARRDGLLARLGPGRDGWALAGAAVVLLFVLAAVFAPLITGLVGQNPYTYHLSALNDQGAPKGFGGGISATHPFGVEPLARAVADA